MFNHPIYDKYNENIFELLIIINNCCDKSLI